MFEPGSRHTFTCSKPRGRLVVDVGWKGGMKVTATGVYAKMIAELVQKQHQEGKEQKAEG